MAHPAEGCAAPGPAVPSCHPMSLLVVLNVTMFCWDRRVIYDPCPPKAVPGPTFTSGVKRSPASCAIFVPNRCAFPEINHQKPGFSVPPPFKDSILRGMACGRSGWLRCRWSPASLRCPTRSYQSSRGESNPSPRGHRRSTNMEQGGTMPPRPPFASTVQGPGLFRKSFPKATSMTFNRFLYTYMMVVMDCLVPVTTSFFMHRDL